MNRNEKFAARLRELRKQKEITENKKWTCEQVAKSIGLTTSSYTNYENALRVPKLDIIEKLANFYNVSPAYIACFSDHKGNSNSDSLLVLPQMSDGAKAAAASPFGDYAVSPELLTEKHLTQRDILIDIIKDNSMHPHLQKEDWIFIKKETQKEKNLNSLNFGIYALKDKNNNIWIRWVKSELDGSVKVYPHNTTHYESFTFTKEELPEFEVLGTVIKLIRTPTFDDI